MSKQTIQQTVKARYLELTRELARFKEIEQELKTLGKVLKLLGVETTKEQLINSGVHHPRKGRKNTGKAVSGRKKPSPRRRDGVTSQQILRALASAPSVGLSSAGVAEALNRPDLASRIGVQLPYLFHKGLCSRSNGVYSLTKQGRNTVAKSLAA